ncbi:MAG: hypothetical protein WCJ54_07805 [Actinomycetota bacterium]
MKGLANVGDLKVDHSQTVLPGGCKIVISGIVTQPGVGNTAYVGTLPFKNLVNDGKITALVKTDKATTYSIPGNDAFTSSGPNIIIGGISAMPAYNVNNASVDDIPFRDCSNINDIYVDLISGSVTPSEAIIYNVGGIAANSAS